VRTNFAAPPKFLAEKVLAYFVVEKEWLELLALVPAGHFFSHFLLDDQHLFAL
jgi:hypothetical protein